jgi:hypothetical protein
LFHFQPYPVPFSFFLSLFLFPSLGWVISKRLFVTPGEATGFNYCAKNYHIGRGGGDSGDEQIWEVRGKGTVPATHLPVGKPASLQQLLDMEQLLLDVLTQEIKWEGCDLW